MTALGHTAPLNIAALYLIVLYVASRLVAMRGEFHQSVVIDALAVNWLASEMANVFIGYPNNVVAYMGIDLTSALWLSYRVPGFCAGLAEMFYVAFIMFNAAYFFRSAFDAWTHWVGLSLLSWGQLFAVTGGVMRHDLAEAYGHRTTFDWVRRRLAIGKKEAGR